MVRASEHRKAAGEYSHIHTDDPNEEEELAADEIYSTLALCRYQLDVLSRYNTDKLSDEVEDAVDEAADALRDGMNERAIEHLLGEATDE